MLVIAVAFAAISLRLSTKLAAPTFLHGYERLTFFSAEFEGAVIIVAPIWILIEALQKMAGRIAAGTPWFRRDLAARRRIARSLIRLVPAARR